MMIEFSGNGPDSGSWSPFGQDLPLAITTINPKETILGFKADLTPPRIMLENQVSPQLPAPSVSPMPDPFPLENAVPSPTLRGTNSRRYVDDTFFHSDIDIRENRVVPVRRFACTGKCGNPEWQVIDEPMRYPLTFDVVH